METQVLDYDLGTQLLDSSQPDEPEGQEGKVRPFLLSTTGKNALDVRSS